MHFNLIAATALMAMAVSAAPTEETFPGPPVVYVDEPNEAAETAVTLAPPAPTPVAIAAVVPAAVSAAAPDAVEKRAAATCVPQPAGIAYKTSPDTPAAFAADSTYSDAANGAATPLGFTKVFTNLGASVNAPGYAGYTLLQTYDVQKCADKCNAIKGCSAFNIYYERDPSVDPNDASCKDPASVTNIKCVWYKETFTAARATNKGQYRNKFQVVIAGSNGYAGTQYQRGFKIKTAGSNTVFDNRWLQFSPGEFSAVALNEDKNFGGVFQLGEDGKLIEVLPWPGNAAALTTSDGSNQLLNLQTLGKPDTDYIKCGIDNIISCQSSAGWQVASVCRNVPQEQSGLLWFASHGQVPADCSSIGLYVDPL